MTKKQMYIKLVVSSLIRRKARMIVALLAVAIGATIMSGLVTIYYDIPRQLGKEFRSYGANFVVLPSGNGCLISMTAFLTISSGALAGSRFHGPPVSPWPSGVLF